MTTELALEYIPRRMQELGYGKDYHLQFRHFVLRPLDTIEVNGINQLFILIEPHEMVKVESGSGVFDVTSTLYNEMQYEHEGLISLRNYSVMPLHVRFIQIIPKISTHACE